MDLELYCLTLKNDFFFPKKGPFGIVEHIDRQQGLLNPTSFVPYHVSVSLSSD